MSPWGTHTEFFFMCIKLLDGDEVFVTTFKVVDMVDLLSVFVSICFYCYCSRFISMSFFFCVCSLQPRRCDNAIVALSWQPFLHLSQNCLCSCESGVLRSSGFENSLLLHFCEISHWAGPNQLFLLLCVKRIISVYSM